MSSHQTPQNAAYPSTLLRGGRITKVNGISASCAPQVGGVGGLVKPLALAVSLALGSAFVSTDAEAACRNNGTVQTFTSADDNTLCNGTVDGFSTLGGNDTVTIGTFGQNTTVSGNITFDAGNDYLQIYASGGNSLTSSGDVTVDMGDGDDRAILYTFGNSIAISGTVSLGAGDDRFGITDDFKVTGNISAGSGNDVLEIGRNSFGNLGASGGANTPTIVGDVLAEDGDDTIKVTDGATVTGQVSGGNGNDNIELSGGTVTSRVQGDNGDDVINWNSASFTTAAITGGLGSDTVNINDAAIVVTGTVLDGGDDTGTDDGMIDTLNLDDDWSGNIVGADIINWEVININGGTLQVSDAAIAAGLINVNGGGTLNAGSALAITGSLGIASGSTFAGFGAGGGLYTISGNLTNNGLVTTQDGVVGDQVTVSGHYSGSGTVDFDVDLESGTGDTLVIAGDVLPGSQIVVNANQLGGLGNGIAIPVVTIAGTNQGSYALAGGPIESGVWTYDLINSANDVSLSAQVNALGAVYESAPGVLLDGFTKLPTLEQRVGQRQWVQREGEPNASQRREGLWLRMQADRSRVTPDQSTSGSRLKSNSWGVQGGADVIASANETGHWVLGLTAQYQRTQADITNALGQGSIKADGYGAGLSATWYRYNGTYLDAQFQANHTQSDYSAGADSLASKRGASAYAASMEAGYRHALDAKRTLVPQAQLSWGQLQDNNFTDSRGNQVSMGSTTRSLVRLGLAYEYRPEGNSKPGQGLSQEKMVYGIVNLVHDFSSASRVNVTGTELLARGQRTWLELGMGGSVSVAKNTVLYGQASYKTSLSGNASNNDAIAGNIGLRRSW